MLGGITGSEQQLASGNLAPQKSFAGTRRFACAAAVAAFGALLLSASQASAAPVVHPSLVQTIDTSRFRPPSPDPAGIVYRPIRDQLVISDSEVDETSLYQGSNLFSATRTGLGIGSGTTLAFSKEPTGLGLDPSDGTLYVSDDDKDRVFVVRPGRDGTHGTGDDIVSRFSTAAFGSTDPEDVAYDPASGHLFIGDGSGLEIYDVNPVNGVFGDGNDKVSHFDVARYGLRDCEGLGIDTSRNTLLAVDEKTKAIYELGKGGALLRILSLSAIPTTNQAVADVTMAPTSSPVDSPFAMDYWIVDRHVDNKNHPNENDGLIYEMR
jgi:DNA-binding beta-propeller fold protein YncE